MLIFTRHIIIPREWNYRLRSTSFCRVKWIILLLNQLWISFYYRSRFQITLYFARHATTSLIYIFFYYTNAVLSWPKKEKKEKKKERTFAISGNRWRWNIHFARIVGFTSIKNLFVSWPAKICFVNLLPRHVAALSRKTW